MRKIISIISIFIITFLTIFLIYNKEIDNTSEYREKYLLVVGNYDGNYYLLSDDDLIYTIDNELIDLTLGDDILITYSKDIDNLSNNLDDLTFNHEIIENRDYIYNRDELFYDSYHDALNKLNTLSINEKIGQLLLSRYNSVTAMEDINNYKLSGFVFYEKDFKNKNSNEVLEMINNLQDNSNISLLIATDEEGGRVVRVSSNPLLVDSPFKSPSMLYSEGGMDNIYQDTINKSKILSSLGINLNLAPVVDVALNKEDYIYDRTLQQDYYTTSLYAKSVISASNTEDVIYTLKHFPGYGGNNDTHSSSSIDNRTLDELREKDFLPFIKGINNQAQAILVNHNILINIDSLNEASLSPVIHNILRNDLNFKGVIITDDISMNAISDVARATIKAILAGNNLIITSDITTSASAIIKAVHEGYISYELIDRLAVRTLSFKYHNNL